LESTTGGAKKEMIVEIIFTPLSLNKNAKHLFTDDEADISQL
jgi:hypothetical protein